MYIIISIIKRTLNLNCWLSICKNICKQMNIIYLRTDAKFLVKMRCSCWSSLCLRSKTTALVLPPSGSLAHACSRVSLLNSKLASSMRNGVSQVGRKTSKIASCWQGRSFGGHGKIYIGRLFKADVTVVCSIFRSENRSTDCYI
jgi:hypothetical protein